VTCVPGEFFDHGERSLASARYTSGGLLPAIVEVAFCEISFGIVRRAV
jgi:hypothetical protein